MSVAASWRQHLLDLCRNNEHTSLPASHHPWTSSATATAMHSTTSSSNASDAAQVQALVMQVPEPTPLQCQLLEVASRVRQNLAAREAAPQCVPPRDKLFFASSFEQCSSQNSSSFSSHQDDNSQSSQRRGFCNWLIPGHLMIGQYPGQNPLWDGPSAQAAEQHLETITRQGRVSVFCSLQSETPAQDDHQAWEQTAGVSSTATPTATTTMCGQCFLQPESVRRQLPRPFYQYAPLVQKFWRDENNNTLYQTIEFDDNKDKKKNVSPAAPSSPSSSVVVDPIFLHSPIADLSVPESQEPLQLLLLQLLQHMLDNTSATSATSATAGNAIYIHCWGGRGRAGLVGACLLSLIWPHLTAATILEWVQTAYETRLGHDQLAEEFAYSPQTCAQRAYVAAFVQEYQELYHHCQQQQQQQQQQKQEKS